MGSFFERHQVEAALAAAWPTAGGTDLPIVVAVSGGADSVALLRALHRVLAPDRLIVAHYNHRWRGAESDADEAFVTELAATLGFPCQTGRPDAPPCPAFARPVSEASARSSRYRFLRETAESCGARYLATAHTADDQAETILHRVVRGTGLGGLAGIRPIRLLGPAVTLVRPFLAVRRAQILDYLGALGQKYREDASNAQTHFTRNRIRHRLLPELAEQYNPAVVEALIRLGGLAADVQAMVDQQVHELHEQAVIGADSDAVRVRTTVLSQKPAYLVREFFIFLWREQGWPRQAMTYSHWDQLRLLSEREGSICLPGRILATVTGGELRITGENRV